MQRTQLCQYMKTTQEKYACGNSESSRMLMSIAKG